MFDFFGIAGYIGFYVWLLQNFFTLYIWLAQNYVLVSPFAVLSLICYVLNFHVNRKLWKLDTIENEWNFIHKRFMARFGVNRGMALFSVTFGSALFLALTLPVFLITPQNFIHTLLPLTVVPTLAIISPLAVAVLINDYLGLRELEKTKVTFKVVK